MISKKLFVECVNEMEFKFKKKIVFILLNYSDGFSERFFFYVISTKKK
jgi:hypothetical protein